MLFCIRTVNINRIKYGANLCYGRTNTMYVPIFVKKGRSFATFIKMNKDHSPLAALSPPPGPGPGSHPAHTQISQFRLIFN